MAEWTVWWKIDSIEARDRTQAAIRARKMMLNPRSTATSYSVYGPDEDDGNTDARVTEVDLDVEQMVAMFGSSMPIRMAIEQLVRDFDKDDIVTAINVLLEHLIDR